jgi:hypothetical protein
VRAVPRSTTRDGTVTALAACESRPERAFEVTAKYWRCDTAAFMRAPTTIEQLAQEDIDARAATA